MDTGVSSVGVSLAAEASVPVAGAAVVSLYLFDRGRHGGFGIAGRGTTGNLARLRRIALYGLGSRALVCPDAGQRR